MIPCNIKKIIIIKASYVTPGNFLRQINNFPMKLPDLTCIFFLKKASSVTAHLFLSRFIKTNISGLYSLWLLLAA